MRHPEPGDETLAGLWSFTYAELLARAAHDVNNALNGAVMNLAVVQARARPGADAGALAAFAAAAGGQLEEIAALVEALLGLGRPPRGAPDLAALARQTAALLPANARPVVDGARTASVATEPTAARIAVVRALLTAGAAGTEAADGAGGASSAVRCTITADEATDAHLVSITPRRGAELSPAVRRALSAAGVGVLYDDDTLRLVFPAARS